MPTRLFSPVNSRNNFYLTLAALLSLFIGLLPLPAAAVDLNQVPTDYLGNAYLDCCITLHGFGDDASATWSFTIDTLDSFASWNACEGYDNMGFCDSFRTFALFDSGTFTLTGPGGLEYTANILSGSALYNYYGSLFNGTFQFYMDGEWNDGTTPPAHWAILQGRGADEGLLPATLTFVTPEPSSLLLLGSGMLALATVVRRRLVG